MSSEVNFPQPKRRKSQQKRQFTKKELDYIRVALATNRPVEDIAAALDRNVDSVVRAIARLKASGAKKPIHIQEAEKTQETTVAVLDKESEHLARLHTSPQWKLAKQQFVNDELRYYETQYISLLLQFGDDILASEYVQIHNEIVYEILKHRNLAEQKTLRDRLEELESTRDRTTKLYPDLNDQPSKITTALNRIAGEITAISENLGGLARVFNDLTAKQQSIMQGLKATRDQRLERVEKSSKNFMELVRQLMDEERREHEGRRAELMRQATLKMRGELTRPFKYLDGTNEPPLMNAEMFSSEVE